MRLWGSSLASLALGLLGCEEFTGTNADSSTSSSSTTSTTSSAGGATSSSSASTGSGGPIAELATVVDGAGLPRAGVDLFVSDAAGNIVETKKTDAAGSAEVDIPVGGSIVYPMPLVANMPTFVLAIVDPPQGQPVRFIDVTAPPANPYKSYSFPWSGATHSETSLELLLSCAPADSFSATTTGTRQAAAYKGCDGDGAFDAAFIGRNFAGNIVSSGMLSMPGSLAAATTLPTIPLVTTAPTVMNVAIASIPPGSTDYYLKLNASRNGRALWTHDISVDAPSGTVDESVNVAAALFDHFEVLQTLVADAGSYRRRIKRQSSASLPASASWAPTTPPFPAMAPAPDLPARTFRYRVDGQLGDAVMLGIFQQPPAANGLFWFVLGRASNTTVDVVLPTLPAEFAGYSLENLDTTVQTFHLALDDRASFGDVTADGLYPDFAIGFRGDGSCAVRLDEYLAQ